MVQGSCRDPPQIRNKSSPLTEYPVAAVECAEWRFAKRSCHPQSRPRDHSSALGLTAGCRASFDIRVNRIVQHNFMLQG